MPAGPALLPLESDVPITPSAEAWLAMSEAARDRFVEEASLALEREAARMPEGFPHFYNKNRAYNLLRDHFDRAGRSLFLACELPVLYPGAPVFAPDLIAVVDVEPEGAAERRMCWSVAVEKRGVDLALEIVMAGDRAKDLGRNVQLFAQLGITEYFVTIGCGSASMAFACWTAPTGPSAPAAPPCGRVCWGWSWTSSTVHSPSCFMAPCSSVPPSSSGGWSASPNN